MMSKFGTFRKLSWHDRALLLEAWLLMIGVRLNLKMFGLQRVQAFLERFFGAKAVDQEIGEDAARISRAVAVSRLIDIASRYAVVDNTCLDRSLVLWWLLARRQIPSRLHYGVRRQASGFEAHAWVECSGRVINDSQTVERDYTPLSLTPSKHDV